MNNLIKRIPIKNISEAEQIENDFVFDFNKNENKSNRAKLKIIYKYLDLINEKVSQYSNCKKGCSHCCELKNMNKIELTEVELKFIRDNVRINDKLKSKKLEQCQFLKNNECSIYEFRPFMCRKHLNYNSEGSDACVKKNKIQPVNLQFSEVEKIYLSLNFGRVKNINEV